jgi:hypothetical protein
VDWAELTSALRHRQANKGVSFPVPSDQELAFYPSDSMDLFGAVADATGVPVLAVPDPAFTVRVAQALAVALALVFYLGASAGRRPPSPGP